MVVKTQNAVIAIVTVRGSYRAEYVAELTELKFCHVSITSDTTVQLRMQVEYFLISGVTGALMKLRVDLPQCFFIKEVLRYNTRICEPRYKHQYAAKNLQY